MYIPDIFRIVLLIICPLVSLQSQPDTLSLSLEQSVAFALKENRAVQIAGLEISKTNYLVHEVLGSFYPKAEITGQYLRNLQRPVIFLPEGSPFGTVLRLGSDNSYSTNLSLSVPVYSAALSASVRLARQGMELAGESSRGSKINAAADVRKAYYNALLAHEAISVIEKAYQNAKENVENIRQMNKQGVVADYDLIRAEVQSENLKPQLEQAQDNYEFSVNMLKNAIGIPAQQQVLLMDSLTIAGIENNYDLATALVILQQQNTNLKQMDLHLKIAGEQTSLSRSARYPYLAAFGNYQVQSQTNDFKFGEYKWVNTSLVGLQLKFPVFNGFATNYKIKQNEITARELSLQKEMVTEILKVQLMNIVAKINLAKSRIESQKQTIALAEKGLSIARVRYHSGAGTILELNDAEAALMQAKLNYLQTVYDFRIAVTEFEKLTGYGY
ncbi:MAG: TolC family protein [Bacteroidetes bacterium]|nr:TolC family protein [Bacteroidota bacterium]